MSNEEYNNLVNKYKEKEHKIHNYKMAFLSGGILGAFSEFLYIILKNMRIIKTSNISFCITLVMIGASSFLTTLGIFDRLICKYRSGLIIPTTGFAHSIASSGIDAKKEGLITGIGPAFFSLAGSVILYSVVGSFFLVLLKVIVHG